MYVEILEGRHAGKVRDIDDSVVQALIQQGRVRSLTVPTAAAPIPPGGYRGMPPVRAKESEAPAVEFACQVAIDTMAKPEIGKKKHR